ncbi:PAS domain S-box-containing protein [Pseudoduganella lurida]|uniref:Virulence sensor protein BvgS n=1 Tax=Pseudoduganella lurida TaxID=1036180 RepID=A0A562RCL1_9BURK|nr:MHYT domain-containing protein [Pseudoduganella lurida]TWI66166.1 PAS domain S-box-containing protein [Pseudoduganella lurida]
MIIQALTDLFSPPADPSLLQYGTHDPKLVALSVLVAIFASWMGLQLAGQQRAATNRTLRVATLVAGSLALGSGVWAMHFIGMLAFDLCTDTHYDPAITLLSMAPSLAASAVALSITRRDKLNRNTLLVGGVLVGAGIGMMHYAGMGALRTALNLRYDPLMFALSIIVAVVLATVALGVRFGLRGLRQKLSSQQRLAISAIVMGSAIAGMHYTGMAAARFVGHAPAATTGDDSDFLALSVTAIAVLFTIAVVGVNGLVRYREMYRSLLQGESWMRALMTTTVDGVVTIGQDGIIQEVNASAERIFGWTREEIIGQPAKMLMADPEESERIGLLASIRAGDTVLARAGEEVMGRRKDGSEVPIRKALGHAQLSDRNVYVLFITDISERRQIMQALRDSEEQFRSLISSIPGISFRARAENDYPLDFISDGVEWVTGYPVADFVGPDRFRTMNELVSPVDLPRVEAICRLCAQNGLPYTVEYRIRHADGAWRWVWEHGTMVRGEDGKPRWFDGVILDTTERRQMEEDLRHAKEKAEQAAASRATFVANMSHEIRTPMNSILGFTDVLLDSDLKPEQRGHLDTVRNAGRALLRLLNEILDTAKLEKGAVELELADFSLLSLIDELSSTYNNTARSKGLALNIRFAPGMSPWLHGDELRVRQVLTNLLDNAIKFTASGSVTLSVAVDGPNLAIAVRDTGIGIAPDRLAAIFEPFTQADASMTRRFGGTGLGTTISKQLVELMKGRIWAESTPGQGTTFHVVLPHTPALEPHLAHMPRPRQRIACELPPLRVLAADDVTQNLELLALLMAKRGHTLTMAHDGAHAAELAATQDFDVILMDVQMPVLDGLAATRRIRAEALDAGRTRVPIIAMTASVLEAHRKASTAAGMDGFASKPVDWYALSHEIARVLGLQPVGAIATTQPQVQPLVLNRKAGAQRWGGSEEEHQIALCRFDADHAACAQRLAALHDAGDLDGLHAEAHRVRGVAANLGFEQLVVTLADIERRSAAASPDTTLGATLQELAAQLDEALADVRTRACPRPDAINTETPAAAFDVAAVHDSASALRQSLKRGALDDDALARLSQSLLGHVAPAMLAPLHMALGDFDFSLAETRLDALLETLLAAHTNDDMESAT